MSIFSALIIYCFFFISVGDAVPFYNGKKDNGIALSHFDRIAFGRFHLFRFEACGLSGNGQIDKKENDNNSNGNSNSKSNSNSNIRISNDSMSGRHSVTWEDEQNSKNYNIKKSNYDNNNHNNNDSHIDNDNYDNKSYNPNKNQNKKSPFNKNDTHRQTDRFENFKSHSSLSSSSVAVPPGWEYAQEELMVKNDQNGNRGLGSETLLSPYDDDQKLNYQNKINEKHNLGEIDNIHKNHKNRTINDNHSSNKNNDNNNNDNDNNNSSNNDNDNNNNNNNDDDGNNNDNIENYNFLKKHNIVTMNDNIIFIMMIIIRALYN